MFVAYAQESFYVNRVPCYKSMPGDSALWNKGEGYILYRNFRLSIDHRLSENTKSENFGYDIKGFMSCKSVRIPILGQPDQV